MKKFKKSLVILPALATMALTTVASVTGTVAWFTANRTVSVTGSTFETVAENSNLTVTLTAGQGTEVENGKKDQVSVDGKLTHGSYDAKAGHTGSVYVANLEGTTVLSYSDKGAYTPTGVTAGQETSATTWKSPASTANNNIYYAVGWKMSFNYDGAAATGSENHLLFDIAACSFADATTTSTSLNANTIQGFRIAFMSADKVLVVGGNSGDESSHVKYVSGTSSSSTSNYIVGTNYQVYSASKDKAVDGYTKTDYTLYDFGKITQNVAVEIYCVAWYEGEDTSVVDTNVTDGLSKVTATLPWYVRSTATA